MIEIADGIVLYHGSYCKVTKPDLSQCAKYKDFGKGFYLTTSKKQAENFARISTRKAIANGIENVDQRYGIISSFRVSSISGLRIMTFQSADAQWLHCVVGHRKMRTFPEVVEQLRKFDIISGKVADDNTNHTINAYMAGTFGVLGTEGADNICTSLLLPDRLQDQFCFRSEAALAVLTFIESEQVWMR